MAEDADYLYALEMQRQLNSADDESDIEEVIDFKPLPPAKAPLQLVKRSNPRSNMDEEFLNRTQNLVHPLWETLDPTPDVNSMFVAFDGKFFQGRLKCVTLEWSKRMYSCAGICYSRRNRLGMEVTIRLSEPLLKLRPRKDLIETMLHEMIHAYCFVLNIREGNGGHGPNFKKIMYGINKVAGTNITVYHTFHDEVDLYKQHWWRCNGICQNRSPFFGYVKRTCNRAPGPNDQWWAAHLESCGGTFMKIKEPEKQPKQQQRKATKKIGTASVAGADVRKYFPPQSKGNTTGNNLTKPGFKGPIKFNGGGTMLLNPKTKRPSLTENKAKTTTTTTTPVAGVSSFGATAFPPTSYPGLSADPLIVDEAKWKTSTTAAAAAGSLANVRGLRDLSGVGGTDGYKPHLIAGSRNTPIASSNMSGRGYSMSATASNSATNNHNPNVEADRNHVRNLWAKKFSNGSASGSSDGASAAGDGKKNRNTNDKIAEGDSKRRRISSDSAFVATKVHNVDDVAADSHAWVIVDDDIMLQDRPEEVIALSSDSSGDDDNDDAIEIVPHKPIKLSADERQKAIKEEILDETMDTSLTNDDIVLIDDDYNDDEDLNTSAAIELADTSLIDDFFGEDTLLKEFKRENDVIASGSRRIANPQDDIITCPICQDKMKRCVFAEHLDGCTGIVVKVVPPTFALKKLSQTSKQLKPTRRRTTISRATAKDILRKAGYDEQDLMNITSASSVDDGEEEEEDSFNNSLSMLPPPSTTSSPPTQSPAEQLSNIDTTTRRYRQRNLFKTTRQCPVCAQEIEDDLMNEHLDDCLSQ